MSRSTHIRNTFTGVLLLILVSVCNQQTLALSDSLAARWVEQQSYAEVLKKASDPDGFTLFSRTEFAKALMRPQSRHSQSEREIAAAVLIERTPIEEAAELLRAVVPYMRTLPDWSLLESTMRVIWRTPEVQAESCILEFVALALHEIASTVSLAPLPRAARGATLAVIQSTNLLTGPSPAESLRIIAQFSDSAAVVELARATARNLLSSPQ
ncbi:MAG: hypothetical protein ACOC8L_14490 [Spirochaetota bacterium]